MAGLPTPTQLAMAFAANGVFNSIPVPSQISTNPGLASYNDGFPPATRAPVASGGVPPYGEDMNGILNAVTVGLQYLEAGGAFPYNSTFATAIGGYPLGAMVQQSDGNGLWMNATAGNTANPETAGVTSWKPVDKRGQYSQALLSTAAVALTNIQSAFDTLILTGVPTLAITVTLAPYAKSTRVINQCTGAFATVAVNVTGGTGVSVLPGGEANLYSDGTNMYLPAAEQVGGATQSGHAAQFGQLTGLAGAVRGLSASVVTTPNASVQAFAYEVITQTAQNGLTYSSGFGVGGLTLNTGTTGLNGMDTGLAPVSGYVAIYAIYNPTTQVTGLLGVDTTASAPSPVYAGTHLPAGFTASGLIAIWPTNASRLLIIAGLFGRKLSFAPVGAVGTSTTSAALVSASLSGVIPFGAISIGGTVDANSTISSLITAAIASGSSHQGEKNCQIVSTSASFAFDNAVIGTAQTIFYWWTLASGTGNFVLNVSSYEF